MSKRTLAILFGALALIGLADASYMAWDHYQHAIDPAYGGGLCGVESGCDISRGASGEILNGILTHGVPLAVIAMAFYVAFLLTTFFRLRRPDDRAPARVQLGLAALAVVYSLSLATYSLIVQGTLCKLCAVMYVVNILLLGVAWRGLGEPIGTWLRRVWGAIPRLTTVAMTATFIAATVAIYALYALRVDSVLAARIDTPVTTLRTEGRPSKGPADAPVQLVEIADLECPHCGHLFNAVEEVAAARPDDLRVTFVHFPLDKACNPALKQDFHRNACWLARVADCAGRQGKFFEATKILFERQRAGSNNDELLGLIAELGVDRAGLEACVASEETAKRILADIQQGLDLEISGTPVFFINGHRLSGARSPKVLNELIDQAMKEAATR
jgi:protein-disulfide isomerase